MSEKFKSESGDSEKTDWSYADKIMKKRKEEERANMTPEELTKDNEKQKQVEGIRKWAERSKRIEQGDPGAIAEFEAEKKALHEKLWKGAETARVEEEGAPEKIDEAKKELGNLYGEENKKESFEKTDKETAEEMIGLANGMKFEDLLSFSLEVYRKIKDKTVQQETHDRLTEIIKSKQAEAIRLRKEEHGHFVKDLNKKRAEEHQKYLEEMAKLKYEAKRINTETEKSLNALGFRKKKK